jgi:hypothetical protein
MDDLAWDSPELIQAAQKKSQYYRLKLKKRKVSLPARYGTMGAPNIYYLSRLSVIGYRSACI